MLLYIFYLVNLSNTIGHATNKQTTSVSLVIKWAAAGLNQQNDHVPNKDFW